MSQKIGISLSGGAAYGFSHIGFLQAIDDAGIEVECITGTSMGALIGALYAAGYSPYQILIMLGNEGMHRIEHIFRPNFRNNGGIIDTQRLERKLQKYIPHNTFEKLERRYYCNVLNMNSLQEEVIGEGGMLSKWVMASLAIPPFFAPVKVGSSYYFDGGLVDIMPVEPLLREGCDERIGVSIKLLKPHVYMKPTWMSLRALEFMCYATTERSREKFTEVVDVDCGKYGVLNFRSYRTFYEVGYNEGRAFEREWKKRKQEQIENKKAPRLELIPNGNGIDKENLQGRFRAVEQPHHGAEQGRDDVQGEKSWGGEDKGNLVR